MIQSPNTEIPAMEDPTFPIPNLPNDVIVEILTWLPVKPLLKFKSVCKSWRALISSQQFVKSHLKALKSSPNLTYNIITMPKRGNVKKISVDSVLYDSVSEASDLSFEFLLERYQIGIIRPPFGDIGDIYSVGSCNGLVLVYWEGKEKELFLWNPSTRAYKMLPSLYVETHISSYGLGYDKSSDDYKVVRFSHPEIDECENMVHVYSLRNDRWKRIGDLSGYILMNLAGEFTNGKLYWVAQRGGDFELGWDILSLDLEKEEEECEILQMPSYVKTSDYSRVIVCEGSLYLICTHKTWTDVWILDGCSVGIEKWAKVITIPWFDGHLWCVCLTLVRVEKNGLVLFRSGSTLLVYDAKDCSFRYPEVRNLGIDVGSVYVESLVSPVG